MAATKCQQTIRPAWVGSEGKCAEGGGGGKIVCSVALPAWAPGSKCSQQWKDKGRSLRRRCLLCLAQQQESSTGGGSQMRVSVSAEQGDKTRCQGIPAEFDDRISVFVTIKLEKVLDDRWALPKEKGCCCRSTVASFNLESSPPLEAYKVVLSFADPCRDGL